MIRWGLGGAAVGAAAMWAWIVFVNRPFVERFTIVYDRREMVAEGQKLWRRDPGRDTMDPPRWTPGFEEKIDTTYPEFRR